MKRLIFLVSRRPFPVRHESDNSDGPGWVLSLLSLSSLDTFGTKSRDFIRAEGALWRSKKFDCKNKMPLDKFDLSSYIIIRKFDKSNL